MCEKIWKREQDIIPDADSQAHRDDTMIPARGTSTMSTTEANSSDAAGQAKAAQSQSVGQQPDAINTLPLDIWLSRVLPLTPLQDLLPLCSTSKWLGDELKHDVVIKAALAKRGYAVRSLANVMSLVERGELHMPSAMRLLRLTLGQKCEKLDQCRGILIDKRSSPNNRKVVAKNFGVFMCNDCISCHVEKGTFDWTGMYVDRCGEICGPSTIPTLTLDDAKKNEVKRILTVFEKLNGTYVEARTAKRERDAEVRVANQAKRAKKFTSVLELLRRNLREKEWIDIALATNDGGILRSPIAREILGDFAKAPSKATSLAVAKVSKQLRETFDFLWSEIRFHDFSAIENFMGRDGRWDEDGFTSYTQALKDELLRVQMWTKTPNEIYHNRCADMVMVNILRDSWGSRRTDIYYDKERTEAIARLTVSMDEFGFDDILTQAVSRAVPLVPESTYHSRRRDMRALFLRYNDICYCHVDHWEDDFRFTIALYEDLQRQMEKYASLSWVFPLTKRERLLNNKDLMVRIGRVRNDFSEYVSSRHPFLDWLLDGSSFKPVQEKKDSCKGFQSLLSWHEESARKAASLKPQRDIRLYF